MIGERLPMVDAVPRVTGAIDYVQNLRRPGMLHASLLRSPYAHARILSVDLEAARAIPGVVTVIGPDEVRRDTSLDPWFGPFLADQPVLPLDRVRYAGEPVVAVAAIDEQTAQAALDAVVVRYEALPAVLDIDAALAPGAPVVHAGARRLASHRADIVARQPGLADTNVIHSYRLRRGDIHAGFAAADVVVERTYRSPAVQHVPLESHVAVAEFTAGTLTMWASSQAPSMLAAMLAGIFRLPSSDVRVIVSTLGGGYGAKVDPTIEPIVALLAREAHRPVRLSLERNEEFLTATKHAAKVSIRTGARRDGTLVGHQATCWYDGGAYAKDTPEKLLRGYASTGPYRVPNIHVDSFGVYTNRVPSCAFRGFGIPQVAWAHEAQMDLLADALGRDPLDLRRQNILVQGDPFSTGELLEEDPHYLELLDDVARRIGWTWPAAPVRDGPRVRATGISAIIKGSSAFPANSTVKLNPDGSLNVLTSSVEMGQGSLTALAQIAADEATLPISAVRVSLPDTSTTPFDHMTAASRTTNFGGRAIRGAVRDIKTQLLELAAEELEIDPRDLRIDDGHVVAVGSPERRISFRDLLARTRVGDVHGRGRYLFRAHLDVETGQGVASSQWHPAVCGVEVEVDEETGKVAVRRLHLGLYVGRMINPLLSELQVQGAALFGVGQALFEEMLWDESGTLTNGNLSDYMIPSFIDVPPELGQTILETPGSIDVHGLGETALPGVAPAIANAVSRAIGVRVDSLPITPEKVLRLIRERDGALAAS